MSVRPDTLRIHSAPVPVGHPTVELIRQALISMYARALATPHDMEPVEHHGHGGKVRWVSRGFSDGFQGSDYAMFIELQENGRPLRVDADEALKEEPLSGMVVFVTREEDRELADALAHRAVWRGAPVACVAVDNNGSPRARIYSAERSRLEAA